MTSSRRRLLSAMHLAGLTFREVCLRIWTKINEHEILTRAAAILPRIVWVLPWVKQDAADQGTAAAIAIALLQDLLPADPASLLRRELTTLQEKPPTGIISFGLVALLWLLARRSTSVPTPTSAGSGSHPVGRSARSSFYV